MKYTNSKTSEIHEHIASEIHDRILGGSDVALKQLIVF